MRRRTFLMAGILLGLAACAADPTGLDNAAWQDRQAIAELLDASGWFADAYGVDGAADDLELAAAFDLGLAPAAEQDTVPLTPRWGRRRGPAVRRTFTATVVGDTAVASVAVTFDGVFLLDRTRDGVANPSQKPLEEQAVQRAVLVRRAEPDSAGRRWQIVRLSPREWRMTDETKRTVTVTRVVVRVNGETKLDVSDPAALLDVDDRMPRLHLGDSVSVLAEVENTTGTGNVPPTFVFLHVFHHGPAARGWVRIPMRPREDGVFVRHWLVRFAGRERIVVDAIDSQTFNTDGGDDYRANGWGVPYRIE